MADYLIEVADGVLWQWDTGRKIKIQTWENKSVTEAHFSIVGSDQALVLAVYEENGEMFADIPNILLQQKEQIVVYLVNDERTVDYFNITIIPRAKPDDYVYTETEIKNYKTLETKIPTKMSQLEKDISEKIEILVIREDATYTVMNTFEDVSEAFYKKKTITVRLFENEQLTDDKTGEIFFLRNGRVTSNGNITLVFNTLSPNFSYSRSIEIHADKDAKTVKVNNPTTSTLTAILDKSCYKKNDIHYSPESKYDLTTKQFVEDSIKENFIKNMAMLEETEIVPSGNYLVSGSQGVSVFGKFKIPIVGQEYSVTYGSIETTKIATAGNRGVRIGDNYGEFIIEFPNESEMYIESANTGMKNIHITGNDYVVKFSTKEEVKKDVEEQLKPLILYAEKATQYTEDATIGDETLNAILTGRQIVIRVPNADGKNYTAIFSPILTYQLPNYANEYLYLFYLRDEKQNIDLSAMGLGIIPMPIYGELKLKLSQEYNECPLT